MAKNRKHLLIQHLEDVSWRVLEDYPIIVRGMIRGQSGVYALYKRGKLYYVGLASDLMVRLKQHLKDRHNGCWDRFSVFLTWHDEHLKELESLLLRIVSPEGNRQVGKFASSLDLRQQLAKQMREADADKRALVLGGKAARRRQQTKIKQKNGTRSLNGVIRRRMVLKAFCNDYEYTAALLKNGAISYDGQRYDSPSAAAAAALGYNRNGWKFWRYRDEKGEWVQLRALRR